MKDFEYVNPVHVVFGNGSAGKLGEYAKQYGSRALLVTYADTGFIEPLLAALHGSLSAGAVACIDYYGAAPSPTLEQAKQGIALCREQKADLVIGVGGGSAMDLAKAIAAGVLYEGELQDMFLFSHSVESGKPPVRALPMILIPTLPATGSEMNCTAVITDEKSRKKSYVWAPDCLYAKVALMDPELTAGLPPFQTACGAIDTVAHIAESYFNGGTDTNLLLQDRMQEAVIGSVLETLPHVMAHPEDLEARGVMLWAASVALNGWLLSGTYTWAPMHQMGHVLSARYGATHGATLGTMIPAWMHFFAERPDNKRYRQFAERIFGKDLNAAAEDFTKILGDNGLPTGISAFGVKKEDIPAIAGAHRIRGNCHTVDFKACTLCGACVDRCPSKALTVSGRRLEAGEVPAIAERDQVFYGEEGGVTFSGGEAMLWPVFLLEAARACKRAGIGVAIDTCGLAPFSDFEKLLPYTDLFLYDIKVITPAVHKAGTGRDNRLILDNYRKLLAAGARVWVRIPVVGGFNASKSEMERIATFLQRNPGAEEVVLMPFHFLGKNKYESLGYRYTCTDAQLVDRDAMRRYQAILRAHHLPLKTDEEEVSQ